MTTTHQREIWLKSYRKRREMHLYLGLTAHGTPRRRRAVRTRFQTQLANLENWRRRSKRLVAAGLTTRGTARKYFPLGRISEQEAAWKQLRNEMQTA